MFCSSFHYKKFKLKLGELNNMKKNGYLKLERKKLIVALATFGLVISAMLVGCGSSTADTTPITKEEVVDSVEEKTDEEAVQAETVEEVETFQSAKEWAQSVDTTEPKMTIWNDTHKEGIILEDGQKYVLRQDDTLLFCTKEKQSGISLDADIAGEDFELRTTDKYVKIQLNKILTKETLFEVRITVAGTEYPFSVTLISEGAEDNGVETNTEDNLIGKEWAATLDYDEVKLLIWNYDNGKKEVIDINGEAIIENGDILAIYCPDRYWVNTILPVSNVLPIEIGEGLCPLPIYKCTLIEEIAYEQKGSTNLEVEIMTESDYEYYNFIVTIQ